MEVSNPQFSEIKEAFLVEVVFDIRDNIQKYETIFLGFLPFYKIHPHYAFVLGFYLTTIGADVFLLN